MEMDRGGRRTLILVSGAVLLALSHWAALRLGMEGKGELRTSNAEHRISNNGEAVAGNTAVEDRALRERRELIGELLRRGVERNAQEKREALQRDDDDKNRDLLLQAAMDKIPADADLKALVEKAAAEAIGKGGINLEGIAGFGVWLDRDAAAAMAWLEAAEPYQNLEDLTPELARWLGAESRHTELAALLDRYPAMAGLLLDAAQLVISSRGAAFGFELVKSLPVPHERVELLEWVLNDKDFAMSHVAELEPYLDDAQRSHLLDILEEAGPKGELKEMLEKAGVSPMLLLNYRHRVVSHDEPEETIMDASAVPANALSKVASMEEQVAAVAAAGQGWGGYPSGFDAVLPDFRGWCAEARDGRLSADELLALANQAWPESEAAGLGPDLRTLVFREIFRTDPVAAVKWYQAGGGDVLGQMGDDRSVPHAEQILALMTGIPDFTELVGEKFKAKCSERLYAWSRDDPQGYAQAVARLGQEEVARLTKAGFLEEE